jgi:hypothetical protein
MTTRKRFVPRNAAGKAEIHTTRTASTTWLPVRPRLNRSLCSKEAELAGSGGEAIRYHPWSSLLIRPGSTREVGELTASLVKVEVVFIAHLFKIKSDYRFTSRYLDLI